MKRIRWRLALPGVHLALALVLYVAGWYEYHEVLRQTTGISLDFGLQHYPAPVQRIAYGLSYPAFVLANATIVAEHAGFYTALFEWQIEGNMFRVTVGDGVFFVGVVLLWYWIGRRLDRRIGDLARRTTERSGVATLTEYILTLILAVAVAYFAIATMNDYRRPIREISIFGLVWAALLIADFVWHVIRASRRRLLLSTRF